MGYIGNTPETEELKRVAAALEKAAAESAGAAKRANDAVHAAKRSAFWTMIAAIVSLVGVLFGMASNLGYDEDIKAWVSFLGRIWN